MIWRAIKRCLTRLKNNSGLIFCLAWVVAIIFIAYCIYQNGLSDKLKEIEFTEIEISTAIRNYFLIFVAIAGAPFLVWRAIIANRNADTGRNNQITQAYSTAIEQLSSTRSDDINMEMRLGAIYALGSKAILNKDYHQSIVEILAGYVFENSPNEEGEKININILIQTVLTTINRIRAKFYTKNTNIYLYNCNLRAANLKNADLRNACLLKADLSFADLRGAHLRGADLKDAYLTNIKVSKKTKFPKGYKDKVKNVSFQKYNKSTDEWTLAE